MNIFGSKKGIRKKLLLSYLAITIPLIIVIVFIQYNRYVDKRQDIMKARVVFARDVASNFDFFVKEVTITEKALGMAIAENPYTRRRASEYLARVSSRYPVYSIDYVRPTGEIFASSDSDLIGTNIIHEEDDTSYADRLIDGKRDWFVSSLHPHKSGGFGFDIVTGIWNKSKSKLIGMVVMSVDSTRLNEVLVFEVPGGGYNISDKNGMLIYQNQRPDTPMPKRDWSSHEFVKVANSGKEFSSLGLTFPIDNTYRMGAQVPIHSMGWSAGSFVPVEQVMAPVRIDVLRSGVVSGVVVLLAVVLGFWIGGRIVKPITVLADKARTIARGSFDEDIGHIKTNDEIEDLAKSFDTMRIGLSDYVGELTGLVEAGEKMNLALNIPFVEGAVANALRNYFNAEAVWIALYDENEKHLKVDYFWSDRQIDFHGLTFAPGQGVAGTVLMTGKPVVIHDIKYSEFLYKDDALSAGIDSAITLPLISGGGSLGIIGLYTPLVRQDRITEKELSLLMALANQAAVAIENARLYEETRQSEHKLKASNEDLRILNKMALDVSSGLNRAELLDKAVRNAVELVGADIGSIVLYDEEKEELGYYQHKTSFSQALPNVEIPEDLGLIGTVLKTRRSIVTNDYRHDPRLIREALVLGIGAVAAVPLLIGNRLVGIMQIASTNGKVIGDGDMALLESIGSQVAVAIENARLYERERDVAETLQNALLAVPDNLPGVKIGLLYRAATDRSKVGGDFYDFIELSNGRIGIVVGDVSGKGLEAATATALAKMTVKAFAYECRTPEEVLKRANSVIYSQMTPGQFITIAYIVIDPATGEITYASAGHPSPVVIDRKTSAVRQLRIGSEPLGVIDNPVYEDYSDKLTDNEIILLYTDGLLEARSDGHLFGEEGIIKALLDAKDFGIDEIPGRLLNEAEEFAHGKLNDDVAIVVLAIDQEGTGRQADHGAIGAAEQITDWVI